MDENFCFECDFYDIYFGCTCPPYEKWYACPYEPDPSSEEFITE